MQEFSQSMYLENQKNNQILYEVAELAMQTSKWRPTLSF